MARRTRLARLLGVAGVAALGVALAGLVQAPPVVAAEQAQQTVPIPTVDGVELVGTYYRGNAGRDTPCVLMVHRYGDDSNKADWVNLARDLNNLGYAVLTFDLRGHGKSKAVDPSKFWSVPSNRQNIRITGGSSAAALAKHTTISHAEFQPRYLPMLVNDITAARRYLEIKNDSGELNASSIVVVGVQEGAALGMLFAATEYTRYYRTGVVPLQSEGTRRNAGEDLAAGVWLSLPLAPAQGVRFAADNWLRNFPAMRDKFPMCFVYGEKDKKAKDDVDAIFRTLSPGGREKPKNDIRIELKGTDLTGLALLSQPVLDVNKQITEYVKRVVNERKAIPWSRMDPDINRINLVNLRPFGFQ